MYRRIVVLEQRAAKLVHVDHPRVRLAAEPRTGDVPRRRVAHRIAAATDPEFSGDRRQRENRHRCVAAIAIALETPAAFHHGRRHARVVLGEPAQRGFGDGRDLRGALECPRRRPLTQPVGTFCVLGEKRRVGKTALEEMAVDREGNRHIGAGPRRQMEIGLARQRRRSRVDHDESRAGFLSLAHVGNEVDARRRRVDAPQNDEARVGIVLVRDRGHLSVECLRRDARGRRAYRARKPRCAEPVKEDRVERVLCQEAVRSAVGEREDRLSTPALAYIEHARGDELDRLVPRGAPESALSFQPGPHGGILQTRLAVHAVAEFANLRTDVAARRRVQRRAVDLHDPAFADRHGQTARIRTVERARGVDDMRGLTPSGLARVRPLLLVHSCQHKAEC